MFLFRFLESFIILVRKGYDCVFQPETINERDTFDRLDIFYFSVNSFSF